MPLSPGPGYWMLKAASSVALLPSSFVTTTLQSPVDLPARSKSQVMEVGETTATPVASMSGRPDL